MSPLKYTLRSLAALLSTITVGLSRPALDKPNIVIIFLDDSGYADFSHTGNPTIHTPEVSKLVREGLNFPQFYCASPACTASRYALLTGRNPARSGFGDWVLSPTSSKYIHPNEITLAEGLKAQGYVTGMFGKWHLGSPNPNNNNTPNSLPLAHGFDQWLGTNVSNDYVTGTHLIESDLAGTTPINGYNIIEADILNKVAVQESLTGRYRDAAVDFIKAHKNESFLTYIAPNMPHLPIHASDDFKGKSLRGTFGDVMEEIDQMVGTIRKALETEGIAQNTLIIVTSDNGHWIKYQNTVSDSKYGEARALIGSARPFRDGKGSTWEGGVRVPGVFYWPGTIAPRTIVQQPTSTLDILPTVFTLAGAPQPTGRVIDGRNIAPLLSPANFTTTVPPFEFVYTGDGNNRVMGARKGAWKLHQRLFSQTNNNYGFSASVANPLLFNVQTDPGETTDVSSTHAAEVIALEQIISDFNTSLSNDQIFW